MGYQIRYGAIKHQSQIPRVLRHVLLTLGFFAMFLFLCLWYFTDEVTAVLNQWMRYGQVDTLINELREGEQLTDAVATFWQDLRHGQ